MTIHKNNTLHSETVCKPLAAGVTIGAMKQFKITGNINTGDIVEMGIIPPHCTLFDLRAEWSGTEIIEKRGMPAAILHFGMISSSIFEADELYIAPEDQVTDDLSATWKTCRASISRLYNQLTRVSQEENRSIGFKVGADMEYLAGNTITLFYTYGEIK